MPCWTWKAEWKERLIRSQPQTDVVTHTHVIPNTQEEKQHICLEFGLSLGYLVSSGPACTTMSDSQEKKK